MKFNELKSTLYKGCSKVIFETKKHSPEILFVVGVVGVVTSTVMACKATKKADDVIEKSKRNLSDLHEMKENKLISEEDRMVCTKKIATVYVKSGVKLARIYAPSVIVGTASISCFFVSNDIMRKRIMGYAAAYASLDASFNAYRKRVVDEYGEDVDKKLRYALATKVIDEVITDPETGETKTEKKTVTVTPENNEDYIWWFDESNPYWNNNMDYNRFFLSSQERYASELLSTKKYLFGNEVRKSIGLPPTKQGQVTGWRHRPEDKNSDSYVTFRIVETCKEDANGELHPAFLLDPNIEGNILDALD